eukprot:3212165-Amphidinium_carterae.1
MNNACDLFRIRWLVVGSGSSLVPQSSFSTTSRPAPPIMPSLKPVMSASSHSQYQQQLINGHKLQIHKKMHL